MYSNKIYLTFFYKSIMNRTFVIFSVDEIALIDFSQVLETSADTLRRSVDGTMTFVKWDGAVVPACVESLTTKSEYYTYEEILDILAGPDWTQPM
jgi:hypothetical protein